MRFLCVTDVPLSKHDNAWHAYAPYIVEMNLWFRQVDEIVMLCPYEPFKSSGLLKALESKAPVIHQRVPAFNVTSVAGVLKALMIVPLAFVRIIAEMRRADHIHLRCPNNMGLIGCVAQMFFPGKTKSAKYAGNWDPQSRQPFSYKLQRWILRNRFLTRNMQVMVYGNWEPLNKNLLPLFTATYAEHEVPVFAKREPGNPLRLIYAGYLTANKRPGFGLGLVEALKARGIAIKYSICGDGILKERLLNEINARKLQEDVTVHGNIPKADLQQLFAASDFSLLVSESEGWPKAVAEAMFWGCIPIATAVSCVPQMLGDGERGILVKDLDAHAVSNKVMQVIQSYDRYNAMRQAGMGWASAFTIEKMERAIQKILQR